MSGGQLSSSPFSAHSDVLSATPSTASEQASLVEELKRRGRACVTSQRYPDARALYTKAIDVLLTSSSSSSSKDKSTDKDLSILYSNRSLCQLQMNQTSESYSDATSATCHDPDYLKGYWRLGQACVASDKLQEGVDAYRHAAEMDQNNKALKKELAKVIKLLHNHKEKVANKEAENQAEEQRIKDTQKDTDTHTHNKQGHKQDNKATTPPASVKTDKQIIHNNKNTNNTHNSHKPTVTTPDGFTKSEHVRGYKVIGDKKTSYFHHEQTEEEKRLIGDIAPKRIDISNNNSNNNNNNNNNNDNPQSTQKDQINNNSKTSAWNKAGTWEERDVTPWAISTLEQTLLDKCHYTLPPTSPDPNARVKVTKVSKLRPNKSASASGGGAVAENQSHASVATVRGKKRYIFEFTVCLHWTLTFGNGVDECHGTLLFLDIDGTHEIGEGYDIGEFTVEDNQSQGGLADARFLLERFVKNGGLKDVVEKTLDEWILMFRDTY